MARILRKPIQQLRDTTGANANYTGPAGELIWDQVNKRWVGHDGTKMGGHSSANLDEVVRLTTDQTVAGTKTFSTSPQVPTAAAKDVSPASASTEQVDSALYTMVHTVNSLPTDEAGLNALKGELRDGAIVVALNETPYPTWGFNPQEFSRWSLMTVTQSEVTIPAGMSVAIGGVLYRLTDAVTLNVSSVGSRSGKDVYVYAVKPVSGSQPAFVLSLNSTVPSGYTAETSRKIGGFHCLCADVGTISGHTLSGYVAGDILPASVWDLHFRAQSENEGMVYDSRLGKWLDIYLAGWNGSKLVSAYGATIADGTSSKVFHGEIFTDEFAKVNKRHIWRHEFLVAARGSNEATDINGTTDPGTTGGHVDTAGRRMISSIGLEDCCGVLWQWVEDLHGGFNATGSASTYQYGGISITAQDSSTSGLHYLSGCVWQTDGRGTSNVAAGETIGQYGLAAGALVRLVVGGRWGDGASCGSRCVALNNLSSHVHAARGGRGAAEPRVVGSN